MTNAMAFNEVCVCVFGVVGFFPVHAYHLTPPLRYSPVRVAFPTNANRGRTIVFERIVRLNQKRFYSNRYPSSLLFFISAHRVYGFWVE